jgi:hypothetical protein
LLALSKPAIFPQPVGIQLILEYSLSVQIPGGFSGLRETLVSVLDETPTRVSVRDLVGQFHTFATVYLKSLVHRGRIRPHHISLSLPDIAVDCIAPLFERDASGRFPQLDRYFTRLNWRDRSPDELAAYARRLVCSAVHQGVCRLWKETDHSLANILRNLKAGVTKSRTLRLVDEGGEMWVESRTGQTQDLPEMSQEYLDAHISPVVASESTIPRILERLGEFLNEEHQYRRGVPLVMLAVTIRFATTRAGALDDESAEPWNSMSRQEIEEYIDAAVARMNSAMASTYVDTGKTDSAHFAAYLAAVRRLLICRYVSNDGEQVTLYSLLAECTRDLSKDTYRERHRNKLEYLFHCTEKELLGSVKKGLS